MIVRPIITRALLTCVVALRHASAPKYMEHYTTSSTFL